MIFILKTCDNSAMITADGTQFIGSGEVVVVPITYSTNPEGQPSRMSLMAFDVACYIAAVQKANRLIIAGEQSWSAFHMTTGDLLEKITPDYIEHTTVLRDEDRLLNTPRQGKKLAQALEPTQAITLVGFGFHEMRVRDNINAYSTEPLQLSYEAVEKVINELWETAGLWRGNRELMEHEFRQRYGYEVDWPVVKKALKRFERREHVTRATHIFGKNGRVIDALTNWRDCGRYDDISPQGQPITKTTY